MLKNGDKVGIVCCSNGQRKSYKEKLAFLENTMLEMGLQPVFSDCIYEKENIFSGTAKERADALMKFYFQDEIKAIFDISGGDVANAILPYLDFEQIAKSTKMFWGYSDLTTVINAIYKKTGNASVLYQIRNLIYDYRKEQIENFYNSVMENETDLFDFKYKFIQGSSMEGVVIGGNIRCFLKLAGTEYMPDFEGKILLLESLNGGVAKTETYLAQLQQLGAFDKVSGIILGTFTELEREKSTPTLEVLVKRVVGDDMPIAMTREIGHGMDSKGIVIGKELYLSKFA